MERAEPAPRGVCLSDPVSKKHLLAPHQGIQDLMSQQFSGPPLGSPHPPCTVRALCLSGGEKSGNSALKAEWKQLEAS